jgi:hypothetical protein
MRRVVDCHRGERPFGYNRKTHDESNAPESLDQARPQSGHSRTEMRDEKADPKQQENPDALHEQRK